MTLTLGMFADFFAIAALAMLAIYHLMIYAGRRADPEEIYNLHFALFIIAASLFIIAPYFHPHYFLHRIKPSWLYVINIEALMMVGLFFTGIRFLNLLLKFPKHKGRVFYFTYITIPFNFLLTLTANFIGPEFYFKYILVIVLSIMVVNLIITLVIYGRWFFSQRLYKINFFNIVYIGFFCLTVNIAVYRTIELIMAPAILIVNHYISAVVLFAFAYALSVKFNREFFELKALKISLEKKVEERTEALEKSNRLLGQQYAEIEKQKEEITIINEQLSQRANELLDLNQARSRFFAGISHEFRTPITLIMGPLEAMLSQTTNGKTKADYEMMLRQANRLLSLINQLLELSRLQKGVLSLVATPGDLNKMVRTVVDTHANLARKKGIQIKLTAEEKATWSWYDADKLEKIIANLLTNAIKFTPAGGHVEVGLNFIENQEKIEIRVKDDGVGIAKEHHGLIFDTFYQVSSALDDQAQGSGIGLSLVKDLVELHRGTIELNSEPGRGSEFIVRIPLDELTYTSGAVLKPAEIVGVPEEEGNESAEPQVILLVEDNPDMRAFVRSTLGDYAVLEAVNGKEGFELACESVPDLIVADVMMPGMDGLEMTRLLKADERSSHIPIILLTAKASLESKIEGLETQADDYITKPFNQEEFKLRIHNMLRNRQRLQEKFKMSITVTPSELVTNSMDERFLQKALQLVESNMLQTEFSAERFCYEIGMSRTHVHRKLKALTGHSATHFIRDIRLKRAAQLLRKNAGSVSEIAYQSGFNNLSYFTRCFKEQFGVLPSSYGVKENSQ